MRYIIFILCSLPLFMFCSKREKLKPAPGVLSQEFIFSEAPFAECHASTLEETEDGLIAAWFGGPHEKHPEVGIWISRHTRDGWSEPIEVANGVQENGERFACWNPVLYRYPAGPLMLFYKVGVDPETWWGMVISSDDGGLTWNDPRRLPDGNLGPVKNKPILLKDGTLLCPSSTEHDGWKVHFERMTDRQTWLGQIQVECGAFDVIQPTILVNPDGRLQALCRSRQGVIAETWSADDGASWSDMEATELPNPNSGIDAVSLSDGRQLLVYNHTTVVKGRWGGPRYPLNVAMTRDGKNWTPGPILDTKKGEYSYPAVIQTSDELVHITYTWKRKRIKHVVLDPSEIE